MITEITDDNFENEVSNSGMAIVCFCAEWCQPCKTTVKYMEELVKKYSDVKMCKADIEKNPKLTSTLSICSLPTTVSYKNGIMNDKHVGLMTVSKLIGFINSLKS